MALGAWLLLFQNNLQPGGPGGPGGEETLTTFAPNMLPLTAFHSSLEQEIAKENAQAVYLGATGSSLYEDETITSGHTHAEGAESALLWRQYQTFLFFNRGLGVGSSPNEALDALTLSATVETELAEVGLLLDEVQAATVQPRVLVSCDGVTDTAHLQLRFYQLDGTLVATQSPAFSIDTDTPRSRVWVEGTPLDLRAAAVDSDHASRRPLLVVLSGYLDAGAEQLAIHQLSFGKTP